MAIEYTDGSFSQNIPFEEAHDEFIENIQTGIPVKALHYGTEEELKKRKEIADITAEMEELKNRLNALEPPKSDFLHIPTVDDIKKFSKQNNMRFYRQELKEESC